MIHFTEMKLSTTTVHNVHGSNFIMIMIINNNKSITMMRGKSPRSDVEMKKKTKFRCGHLGFLTGISQSILTKLGTHI